MNNLLKEETLVWKVASIESISTISSKVSFDSYIRDFIRTNLSYRYLVTPHTVVRELERHIQYNGINGELPLINSRG